MYMYISNKAKLKRNYGTDKKAWKKQCIMGKINCTSAGHEYPALYHDGKFELYKDKRKIALNIKPEVSPKEILVQVRASVDEFVGNAVQFDDLTMVCVEYRGA